jgi:hypothetical protein
MKARPPEVEVMAAVFFADGVEFPQSYLKIFKAAGLP